MAVIKVKFVVKAEDKFVTVDFYTDNYEFTNHLKRCVLLQIRGSVQKNIILNLVNEKDYTVLENETIIYESKQATTTFNSLTNVNTINLPKSTSYINETLPKNGLEAIDKICYKIDELETESDYLHTMLQKLVLNQKEEVNSKIAALR